MHQAICRMSINPVARKSHRLILPDVASRSHEYRTVSGKMVMPKTKSDTDASATIKCAFERAES